MGASMGKGESLMGDVAIFITGVGVAVLVSSGVVVYLGRSLRKLLVDICGTEDRANFWTAFAIVTLLLVPLIFAMHCHPEARPEVPFIYKLGTQIEWALGGLAASVMASGYVISRFIPKSPREI
jgi:hypothetical protein